MEVVLRRKLHRAGYRFRKNVVGLIGKPDIVFPRERLAVFVDGDYWHARILQERGVAALRRSLKTANREFWVSKLRRNAERDKAVTAGLRAAGWKLLRIWETDLKKNTALVVRTVINSVRARRISLAVRRGVGATGTDAEHLQAWLQAKRLRKRPDQAPQRTPKVAQQKPS